jgi:dephospho-CoA kinase
MKKVGITGGIGSGKTLVSKVIESMGYPVFNSDYAAKKCLNTDPEVRAALVSICGEEIYSGATLNRALFAKKIFSNDQVLKSVNAIIHPRVRTAFNQFCTSSTSDLIFNEAAILIETGAYKNLDCIILVTAPEQLRLKRVMKRDGVTEEEVKLRMEKQWYDTRKQTFSDFRIINDNSQPVLSQVEQCISQLISL